MEKSDVCSAGEGKLESNTHLPQYELSVRDTQSVSVISTALTYVINTSHRFGKYRFSEDATCPLCGCTDACTCGGETQRREPGSGLPLGSSSVHGADAHEGSGLRCGVTQ